MTKDSTVSDFIPSLIAGTISGIIFVVSAMALAALIFTGPLSPYLPQGIGILLVGSIIFALFSALTATYPLILSAPQDIPIAILALMAVSIGRDINGQMVAEEAFQFIFVAIGVTSVLVGLFFWILGRFRLGKLVRFHSISCRGRISGGYRLAHCQIFFYNDDRYGFDTGQP
ncbi:MAG: hypothetical protein Ct9H300mP2_1140 [Candidatus Neomarinimicrobiota bacterium]|nr:MAG: hypothetical protein Ct9H300mP2_1140 [Candidatus Neomarinimicrobiota bacterium]